MVTPLDVTLVAVPVIALFGLITAVLILNWFHTRQEDRQIHPPMETPPARQEQDVESAVGIQAPFDAPTTRPSFSISDLQELPLKNLEYLSHNSWTSRTLCSLFLYPHDVCCPSAPHICHQPATLSVLSFVVVVAV
ncbi:hypothetical protein L596_000353 [Steinernema carpocapsae]|uniref:Uncharacterized protein n=1 Tax=Steinernema carpocapsae TaxID=34508 RepID=A0A4U8UKB3_STECR|nr:hypothetical protein L596_000353 [Steinernema carpocapsae]